MAFSLAAFSASGDKKYLICPVISQDHVTEGSYIFVSGSSSGYVTSSSSLVAIRIVVVEMFLFCHVTQQYHLIKRQDDVIKG